MLNNLFDGSEVNLLIALLAGFLTFFASCLLPLVPTYLAYLSGVALSSDEASTKRWQIFRVALFFVIGFIGTFILLGLTLSQFSHLIAPYRSIIEKAAGILFIGMGLFMLGVFKSKYFTKEIKMDVDGVFKKHKLAHATMTGIAFGFGWTPCIGPILALILYWSTQAGSTLRGIALLTAYGIGLGIPFLIVALGFEKVIPLLKKHGKIAKYASILAGLIVIISGILMFTGQFQTMSLYFTKFFDLRRLAV